MHHDTPIGAVVEIKAPLGLPPVPIPPDNPPTLQTIALGRKLFYDFKLSKDNTVSCATCHNPNLGFTDGLAIARGFHGALGNPQCSYLVERCVLAGTVLGWPRRQPGSAVRRPDGCRQ